MASLTAQVAATPTLARVDIATSTVDPGTLQGTTLTGLIPLATYYVRLFTADESELVGCLQRRDRAGVPGCHAAFGLDRLGGLSCRTPTKFSHGRPPATMA